TPVLGVPRPKPMQVTQGFTWDPREIRGPQPCAESRCEAPTSRLALSIIYKPSFYMCTSSRMQPGQPDPRGRGSIAYCFVSQETSSGALMPVQHHDQDPPGRPDAAKVRLASLALGGAPAGNLYTGVNDEVARDAIAHAWHEGIRHFDTAPYYGYGL